MSDTEAAKVEAQRAAWKQREAERARRTNILVAAGIAAGIAVALNVAFYLLSSVYFADKSTGIAGARFSPENLGQWRLAFAVFTGSVSAATVLSLVSPKWVGHGIVAVVGLAAVVASYFAFAAAMPLVLPVALLVVGLVFPLLVWRSLARSRPAWAFLVSMCFVLAVVFVFGAPKVGHQLAVGLWLAMIVPGMLCVAGVALAKLGRQYR